MNLNKNIAAVLEALDRAKVHEPQDWEICFNRMPLRRGPTILSEV